MRQFLIFQPVLLEILQPPNSVMLQFKWYHHAFNDISQVLEQALFYNVLPSVQSTSPSSPSNCEYLVYYYCYVTVILGTILPYT